MTVAVAGFGIFKAMFSSLDSCCGFVDADDEVAGILTSQITGAFTIPAARVQYQFVGKIVRLCFFLCCLEGVNIVFFYRFFKR